MIKRVVADNNNNYYYYHYSLIYTMPW